MSVSQRDKMRELVRRFGNNDSAIIQEYAAAEVRGEVERVRDEHNMPAEEYAERLLYDGRNRGWL